MKKIYSIDIRGKRKEWSFDFRSEDFWDEWEKDGLKISLMNGTIPTIIVDLGLLHIWCWLQDHRLIPKIIGENYFYILKVNGKTKRWEFPVWGSNSLEEWKEDGISIERCAGLVPDAIVNMGKHAIRFWFNLQRIGIAPLDW